MKTGAKQPQAFGATAQHCRAFSLLEVMIAIMIFCMAAFTILCLVSSSLENTRRLQRPLVDAGVMAGEYSLTNRLVEGSDSGDLSGFLGDAYKGYTWSSAIQEVQSNKLFQVDLVRAGRQRFRQADRFKNERPVFPSAIGGGHPRRSDRGKKMNLKKIPVPRVHLD